VTPSLDDLFGKLCVRVWRSGDVNNVWPNLFEHHAHVIVLFRNRKTLGGLVSEVRQSIADRDGSRSWDLRDLLDVRIGNLSAPDYGNS
jgi:hypothetical protein